MAKLPIKVMVVGNSISHGIEGDFTWRYRIWQWFQSNAVPMEFVGPYTGTSSHGNFTPPAPPRLQNESEPLEPPRVFGGYAKEVDPAFLANSDHFAVWGRQAAQDKDLIAEQVKTHDPDLLLIELGFNDMGWFVSGPEGTLQSMKDLIDDARNAKKGLNFVIANVPQRTYMGDRDDLPISIDTYNVMLAHAISSWDSPKSRITLALFREHYSCEWRAPGSPSDCPASYDGLHPNALGEYQIARAFSEALYKELHIGNGLLHIPANIPERACPTPENFRVAQAPYGIVISWTKVYGAVGYQLQEKINDAGEFQDVAYLVYVNGFARTHTLKGANYQYRLRTNCGDVLISPWTTVLAVTASPETAPGPTHVQIEATEDGFHATWRSPPGNHEIDRYEVVAFDNDAWSFPMDIGVKEMEIRQGGLNVGHRYSVRLATWTNKGVGPWVDASNVRVGHVGVPPVPEGLRIWALDESTVKLTWSGVKAASGYKVWYRDSSNATSAFAWDGLVVESTCYTTQLSELHKHDYEFCISAINGDLESARSQCVNTPQHQAPEVGDCSAEESLTAVDYRPFLHRTAQLQHVLG